MKGYFITATDTDAGKTFITAGLLQSLSKLGYKTLGFKPVASGCQLSSQGLQNEDALKLIAAANVSLDYQMINPYAFAPPIAPHIAAQQANVSINLHCIVKSIQQHSADYVLVEGVGGWLVPLNEQQSIADLARLLGFPIILVVNMRLGCINHALLTALAIEQKGQVLAGWIANNACSDKPGPQGMAYLDENIQSLKARLSAPLLGIVPFLSDAELLSNLELGDYVDLDKCI